MHRDCTLNYKHGLVVNFHRRRHYKTAHILIGASFNGVIDFGLALLGCLGNSLLVIESNTLETHDRERQVEGGDQSQYILNQISTVYPNLYARRQSE
ncbi:MAG: hypothetical protein K2M80_01530, partial [Muribaculaceae bacterium]|nr:hypothetical protein [Muribaculaceae bacterium]